ncbi:MAG: hypothetical protein GY749_21540 [Desulfobacteraceae bacterium]|nr:hypothetical protein [Desulfobacteraceae bacterium]
MIIERGYICSNLLDSELWKSLLEEWCLTTERFCRVANSIPNLYFGNVRGQKGAAPYWFCERAAVSHLLAAVAKIGVAVLGEGGCEKTTTKDGRNDLWFCSSISYGIEAKHSYFDSDGNLDAQNARVCIQKGLNDACDDVQQLPEKFADHCVGVFFIWPRFIGDDNELTEDDITLKIQNLLDIFKRVAQQEPINCDAFAWCFPPETRNNWWNGFYCPGILLIAKEVVCKAVQ